MNKIHVFFLSVDLPPAGPGVLHLERQVFLDGAFVDFSRFVGQFCHHSFQTFNVFQKGRQKFMGILQTEKCRGINAQRIKLRRRRHKTDHQTSQHTFCPKSENSGHLLATSILKVARALILFSSLGER